MRHFIIPVIATAIACSASAEEKRHLDAHEHGVGTLNIAFEGNQIAMELEAPGADIVGFEHAPESAEDRESVDAMIAVLAQPLKLFVLSDDAKCSVVEAKAALVGEGAEHDEHHDEDHAEHHDEHDNEHHGEDHAEGGTHSEFHAEYLLSCAEPTAITQIDFAYFAQFPNAHELEVQLISDKGSHGYEVERDAPVLSLEGAI